MTTPRIEEMVEEITNQIYDYEDTRGNVEIRLTKALTEAHQAGIDEAVEVLEEAKNKANKEATREYGEGVYEGLCHAVHLVKALQDNK